MGADKDPDLLAALREIVELVDNESAKKSAEKVDWKLLNTLLEMALLVTSSPAHQARNILQKIEGVLDPSLRLVKKPAKKSPQSAPQPLENEVEHDEKKQAEEKTKKLRKAVREAERS